MELCPEPSYLAVLPQVFDLKDVRPNEFVEYKLGCLEKFAGNGDNCAKETRERLRIVVAGGDGTVGWVLGCLGELHKQRRSPVPPTSIIPLGTGNDFSRSFGWGGSFPFSWRAAIKKTLDKAAHAPTSCLDSWKLLISMPSGEDLDTPHSLKQTTEEVALNQDLEIEGKLPEKFSCYQGVFYNYFSIGELFYPLFTSLHDLEMAICENGVKSFEELELGPILKYPLVVHFFSVGLASQKSAKLQVNVLLLISA